MKLTLFIIYLFFISNSRRNLFNFQINTIHAKTFGIFETFSHNIQQKKISMPLIDCQLAVQLVIKKNNSCFNLLLMQTN